MSFSDLASLGSFVSGFAVLVSLVFLYFQLRQLNAQVSQAERNQQASIRQGRAAMLVDLNLRLAAPEFSAQSAIGRANPAENEEQVRQFMHVCIATFHLYEENFDQHQNGLLSDSAFTSFVRNATFIMSSTGLRLAWKRTRERFGDDFVVFIDNMIAETPARNLPTLEQFNNDLATEAAGVVA